MLLDNGLGTGSIALVGLLRACPGRACSPDDDSTAIHNPLNERLVEGLHQALDLGRTHRPLD